MLCPVQVHLCVYIPPVGSASLETPGHHTPPCHRKPQPGPGGYRFRVSWDRIQSMQIACAGQAERGTRDAVPLGLADAPRESPSPGSHLPDPHHVTAKLLSPAAGHQGEPSRTPLQSRGHTCLVSEEQPPRPLPHDDALPNSSASPKPPPLTYPTLPRRLPCLAAILRKLSANPLQGGAAPLHPHVPWAHSQHVRICPTHLFVKKRVTLLRGLGASRERRCIRVCPRPAP